MSKSDFQPLAARMRPKTLSDFVGQTHLLDQNKPLYQAYHNQHIHSMILWGPPGSGKTTLAMLLANQINAAFYTLSAVLAGVKDIREIIEKAKLHQQQHDQKTVLFIDEIHRFNKSQQDAFLPHVESGLITLIGATTENPAFALNNALLSRTRTYVLKPLTVDDIMLLLHNALNNDKEGLGEQFIIDSTDLSLIANSVDGDARAALNLLEMAADFAVANGDQQHIPHEAVVSLLGERVYRFDNHGELFYDQISALHKSIRGSDPDAALYWLMRMLTGGCDPLYIARRLVRVASEDIGNADPRALEMTLNAWDVQQRLGYPEGELALAQAVIYLSVAAKSNAVYVAFNEMKRDIDATGHLDVPLHLRNAPRALMKELGYGKNYRYAHDEPDAYVAGECYFPEGFPQKRYYKPVNRGLEIKIQQKVKSIKNK